MGVHSGPPHDHGCLAGHASDAACRCARRDWLRELVPRHQARAELLDQLATWGHEQAAFAGAEIERHDVAVLDFAKGTKNRGWPAPAKYVLHETCNTYPVAGGVR